MKTCTACHRALPLDAYRVKNKTTGTLHSRCTECLRAYAKAHYAANKEIYTRKASINSSAALDRFDKNIFDYLAEHHCVGCGESDPIVLEFDHREPSQNSLPLPKLESGATLGREHLARFKSAMCDA